MARLAARLYWGVCGVLIGFGAVGGVAALFWSPERYDADGALIGEMPQTFGFAVLLVELGLLLLLLGLTVSGARRIIRCWRNRNRR